MYAQQKELSLFQPPPVEKGILKMEWVEYRPIAQISDGATIEFNIPSTGADYIDLRKTRLNVKARIVKEDGGNAPRLDKVAPVNLILHALFRQCDVALQQKVVSPDVATNYAYKAILDVLLNNVDDSQLQSELFFKDTPTKINATDPVGGGNSGLTNRAAITLGSRIFSLEGPLRMDICQQERAILNGVPINVKLYPSNEPFRLQCGEEKKEYKIQILDTLLRVCHVKVSPEVILAHNETLKVGPALYPFDKSHVKTISIPRNSYDYTVDNVFNGLVPSFLTIALVDSEAFAGSYSKSYANFAHFDLSYLEFSVDGNSTPSRPYCPDYKNGSFTTEFNSLSNHQYPQTSRSLINRVDFEGGYALYVFRIAPTRGEVTSETRRGHTRLALKFANQLNSNVTAILYAKFPTILQIDQERNVILP